MCEQLAIVIMMGVITEQVAVLEVTSVKKETTREIMMIISGSGRSFRPVNLSPINAERPDSCGRRKENHVLWLSALCGVKLNLHKSSHPIRRIGRW